MPRNTTFDLGGAGPSDGSLGPLHPTMHSLRLWITELGACLARAATCYRVAAIDSLYVPDTDDIPF